MSLRLARIAVQLARSPSAASYTTDEVAADAAALEKASRRGALNRKAVERVAEKYGAKPLMPDDPHGMAVGLRFRSPTVANGADNVFFVS